MYQKIENERLLFKDFTQFYWQILHNYFSLRVCLQIIGYLMIALILFYQNLEKILNCVVYAPFFYLCTNWNTYFLRRQIAPFHIDHWSWSTGSVLINNVMKYFPSGIRFSFEKLSRVLGVESKLDEYHLKVWNHSST